MAFVTPVVEHWLEREITSWNSSHARQLFLENNIF